MSGDPVGGSQGGGGVDTAVVSTPPTTPRGADWAPRSRACIVQGAPGDPAPWDSWCGCPLRVPEIQGLASQPLRWHGRSHGTHNHRRDAGSNAASPTGQPRLGPGTFIVTEANVSPVFFAQIQSGLPIMTPSHQHERQSHQVAPRNAQLSHLGGQRRSLTGMSGKCRSPRAVIQSDASQVCPALTWSVTSRRARRDRRSHPQRPAPPRPVPRSVPVTTP